MLLINCVTNLILTWSENCVLTAKATRVGIGDNRINNPTNATLKIPDTKLYVPVVYQLSMIISFQNN